MVEGVTVTVAAVSAKFDRTYFRGEVVVVRRPGDLERLPRLLELGAVVEGEVPLDRFPGSRRWTGSEWLVPDGSGLWIRSVEQ